MENWVRSSPIEYVQIERVKERWRRMENWVRSSPSSVISRVDTLAIWMNVQIVQHSLDERTLAEDGELGAETSTP